MEIEDISKVFLISYKDIPRMIKSLDKCVDHAVMSGFGCSHIYNGLTTENLYEKIIVFKNRQDVLATVYEVTKKILSKMTKSYAKLLIAKYVYGYTYNQIANKYNLSMRSVFRYIKKALNEFCYYLRVLGYDNSNFLEGEIFLENIYQNLISQEEKEKKYISKKQLSEKAKQTIKNIKPTETSFNNNYFCDRAVSQI